MSTDKNIRCQNTEDHCVLNCASYVLVAGSFEYGNSISAYIKGLKFLYVTVRKGFRYFPAACMRPNVRRVFWIRAFTKGIRDNQGQYEFMFPYLALVVRA